MQHVLGMADSSTFLTAGAQELILLPICLATSSRHCSFAWKNVWFCVRSALKAPGCVSTIFQDEISAFTSSFFQALDGLPRALLVNLQLEVGLPILNSHALLKHLAVLGNHELRRLCEKALKEARRTGREL